MDEDLDDAQRESGNSFRDGAVHVVSERCTTCIFNPGNQMDLNAGRVKDLVQQARDADSAIICHSTLDTEANAVCRGFYDGYDTAPLRLARRMGCVEFDQPRSIHADQVETA